MKHLDAIHKAVDDHMSKSMQMFSESQKSIEKHAASASALTEALQELATENSEFFMSSMQQMFEATQAMMASLSSGSLPGAVEVQQNYMTYTRDALTSHMARMGEAVTELAKDAGAPMAEAMANMRLKK